MFICLSLMHPKVDADNWTAMHFAALGGWDEVRAGAFPPHVGPACSAKPCNRQHHPCDPQTPLPCLTCLLAHLIRTHFSTHPLSHHCDLPWPSPPFVLQGMRLLLVQGAKPNVETAHGSTPLMFAVKRSHTAAARVLLDAEASIQVYTGVVAVAFSLCFQTLLLGWKGLEIV